MSYIPCVVNTMGGASTKWAGYAENGRGMHSSIAQCRPPPGGQRTRVLHQERRQQTCQHRCNFADAAELFMLEFRSFLFRSDVFISGGSADEG